MYSLFDAFHALNMSKTKVAQIQTRIAVIDPDKCKPSKCRQECKRFCPVVQIGKQCIVVAPTDKTATISEELCIGCNACVTKCPFDAITIINLPSNLERDTTHRYSANSFKLHRLPMPCPGKVLGLIGANGIGKSTALKILAGKLKPNLGRFDEPPDWAKILAHFRGSDLQKVFTKISKNEVRAAMKPQYVDQIPKSVKGTVRQFLEKKDGGEFRGEVCRQLDLAAVLDRNIEDLSGGELQRFAIALVCTQDAGIYLFDEPSSYLDIKQRLKAAQVIRGLLRHDRYIIAVEHDLSVLDYLSDTICCLYGSPGAYGVVTMPFGVREGINIFLDGFIPTENLRFRASSMHFKVAVTAEEDVIKPTRRYEYPPMEKKLGDFHLSVDPGRFTDSETIVLLGENGTGKTTFIKMLAGRLKPDGGSSLPVLNVSYKPQKISLEFSGTVRRLLESARAHPLFDKDVLKPLQIEPLLDQEIQNLSGGELQRVALAVCLGRPADIYLIDEPSAYLDSEQRLDTAKAIKRFVLNNKKVALVVEHDFMMAAYLADRVIVFDGTPSVKTRANSPQSFLTGMNAFLEALGLTFRRDSGSFRPRINKLNSAKDVEQKKTGTYFYVED